VAGYSGTPLVRKLGIAPGHAVLLDGAPAGFSLGELPADVVLHRRAGPGPYDVVLCFCPDAARLHRRWPVLHGRTTPAGALWIAWPKRSAGLATDLDENAVRDYALGHGRVDVKVCAVDEVWSGLKHVIRTSDR
jgi:hypothetical protein